ncbi:MAG: hypothetical protein HUU46_06870 [Candidatus Hydrogenedentes bacterium]|nr:hypothetical protein [Candidatus Hydrogenedentota bacterium]
MIRAFFLLLPRGSISRLLCCMLLIASILIEGYTRYQAWALNLSYTLEETRALRQFAGLAWAVAACVLALLYAWNRVAAFHPLWDPEHLAWLRATPWDGRVDSPTGPVRLTSLDAIWVALISALAIQSPFASPLYPVALFFCTYTLLSAVTLNGAGDHNAATWALMALSGPIVYLSQPVFCCLMSILAYLTVHWPNAKCLREVPFNDTQAFDLRRYLNQSFTPQDRATGGLFDGPGLNMLGWPLTILAPRTSWRTFVRQSPWIASASVALYTFAILHAYNSVHSFSQEDAAPTHVYTARFAAIPFAFTFIFSLFYFHTCAPPISLLGRIATRRFVILSYDRIWLVPFVVGSVAWGTVTLGLKLTGLVPIAVALGYGVCTALVLKLNPQYERWFLTSDYRLRERPFSAVEIARIQ